MRFLLLSLMHRAGMQDAQKAGAVSTDLEWAVLGKKGNFFLTFVKLHWHS